MEAENVVSNLIVKQAHKEKPINVSHMEVVSVVRIVKIGPIQELDAQNMTDIVQLVSNVFSLMMNAVRLSMLIQKK
jgi:hypothetical protein